MKAISLWQPWASLVAIGAKRFETRSWPLRFSQPFAIHAAKKWSRELEAMCHQSPFFETLTPLVFPHRQSARVNGNHRLHRPSFPFGAIIAVCDSATPFDVIDNSVDGKIADLEDGSAIEGNEWHFGDYSPGRYASRLGAIHRIDPIPWKGHQGPFEVPDEIIQAAMARQG